MLVAAVLIVVAAALTTVSLLPGAKHPRPAEVAAALHQGSRQVGSVYIGGHPIWMSMTVDQLDATGTLTCQLVERGGGVATVGTFELVDGRGYWGGPERTPPAQVIGARLIGPSGQVLATASFSGATAGA